MQSWGLVALTLLMLLSEMRPDCLAILPNIAAAWLPALLELAALLRAPSRTGVALVAVAAAPGRTDCALVGVTASPFWTRASTTPSACGGAWAEGERGG